MRKKKIGIYQVVCTSNGSRYVGASTNLNSRKSQHFYDLRHNKHANPRIQADYDKFGDESFYFSVLEIVKDPLILLFREQHWIDLLLPEYNAELKAGYSISHVKKPEVRAKISKSVKKLWENPEYRERCLPSNNWKNGIPNRKGAKLSDETKEKIRQANSGENNPNYGKPRSKETKKKISKANAKTYEGAISPDGTIYAPIHNMSEFCREQNLQVSLMIAVMHGRRESHKGWTRV